MRLVIRIPRRKPEGLLLPAPGQMIWQVGSTREQAERTYELAKSFVDGRNPKAIPG